MKKLNKRSLAAAIMFFGMHVSANEFVASTQTPETVPCATSKSQLKFKENHPSYKFYDKNLSAVNVLRCEKIKLNGQKFYSVYFSAEVSSASGKLKALIYEVAVQEKLSGALKTVRSEIIDQYELSADSVNDKFEYALKADWGTEKKNSATVLRINIFKAGEASTPYHLRLNKKQNWFENAFDLDSKK